MPSREDSQMLRGGRLVFGFEDFSLFEGGVWWLLEDFSVFEGGIWLEDLPLPRLLEVSELPRLDWEVKERTEGVSMYSGTIRRVI